MNGLCITDAAKQFGVTSKTLRYYEHIGLLEAKRTDHNNYRYYDEAEIDRIKQIIILRKMQIPIKDIIRIYENADMSTVVEVFVNRMNAINDEIGALSELKRITNEFLHIMLQNGIKKISALPILYEQMEKQLDSVSHMQTTQYTDLLSLSDKLAKPIEPSILPLPSMRCLTSVQKDGTNTPDGFWRWVQERGIPQGEPGMHGLFEMQTDKGDVFVLRVQDDFINDGDFVDDVFPGGLFAVANVYLDEDVGERFGSLIKAFDTNKYYQIDYTSDGSLRYPAMLESLISPDDQRACVSLLVPVKKRMADPALFDQPVEILPNEITVQEIETANPMLWTVEVTLDKMTPSGFTHYHMTENGEAAYRGQVIRSVLNTNISVKLPFRVDMVFRMSGKTGVVFYHCKDIGYHTGHIGHMGFGINMDNDNERMIKAIRFSQPIFDDKLVFPERGAISFTAYNTVSWIIGKKHIALLINGEVRYCGINFPYMSLDLSREPAQPIVMGAHGGDTICFRSIRVSQLVETPKIQLKKGELTMITKQSNNLIPIIHRLVTDEHGENYCFNGCAKYVMECLGETAFDYTFFAGMTGDVFTQHYTYTKYAGDARSSYMMEENMGGNPAAFVEDIFAKCGYAATYVAMRDLQKNKEMYLNTMIAYIDKGIPVITWGNKTGVYVGYEEYGKVLLLITGNNNLPERVPQDEALQGWTHMEWGLQGDGGWIFVGEKTQERSLADMYREAIYAIPGYMRTKTDTHCYGPDAFRAWAADIENGKFDGMKPEDFDGWSYYTNYVCVLATNSGGGREFFNKAQELHPDFTFLNEVKNLYRITGLLWNAYHAPDDSFAVAYLNEHENALDNLEALGGGFNVTLETLQDKEKRAKVAAVIRKCGDCMDEVMRIIQENV